MDESGSSESTVLRYELKADMAAYLARLGPNAPVKTLKDIIEFNNRNKEKELPYFGQDVFIESRGEGPADRLSSMWRRWPNAAGWRGPRASTR